MKCEICKKFMLIPWTVINLDVCKECGDEYWEKVNKPIKKYRLKVIKKLIKKQKEVKNK